MTWFVIFTTAMLIIYLLESPFIYYGDPGGMGARDKKLEGASVLQEPARVGKK